ncbi:ABC transporter permease [Salinactinospora qingdaonensis]|uniref:ABC transporter permease n=1 Tax=Salinactinospora qingdaonensis TaxID=702744 RepID=A0ABP7FAS8_9ACTN
MAALIGRRMLAAIPLLLFVTALVSAFTVFIPGDPAVYVAGENATVEQIEQTRERLGFDDPWPVRYAEWLGQALQGNLGESVFSASPVSELLAERMPVTLALTLSALLFAVLVGIPAGTIAALNPDRWPDKVVRGIATLGIALPGYWLGLLLLLVFAVYLGLFPTLGYTPLHQDPLDWLRHILLPSVALGAPAAAEVARQLRRSMLDTLNQDFLRTATAKGLRRHTVLGKHALKHAAGPIVTVLATQMALLLGAAVIIEKAFTIPGIGELAVSSVINKDVPVVQGIVVVSTVVIVVTNLAADITNAWLSPKSQSQ